jgi:tRNA threonylcarbamoyladenosine biosynthesis protein TsaB
VGHGNASRKSDDDEYTIPSIASPVLILALDTTTRAGSAAVLRDDDVLAVADGDASRTHGERLPAELEAVLQSAGITLADIDLLTVARGPGAFTGLRIGLAAMQGLAMVTGRPVVGVSALDALAAAIFASQGVERARIGVWMDAARGEVFAASYDAAGSAGGVPTLAVVSEPEVDAPGAIWARWQAAPAHTRPHTPAAGGTWLFTGEGAARYADVLAGVPVVPAPALAPHIARLGRRLAGHADPSPQALQPLYVRRPDVERDPRP